MGLWYRCGTKGVWTSLEPERQDSFSEVFKRMSDATFLGSKYEAALGLRKRTLLTEGTGEVCLGSVSTCQVSRKHG
jgi:hypothetical protein